ncbi:hypothetical protein CVV65_04980 [Kyrpidia spormannii]|uniref:Uncharacterized protein n=1 Tax=Kyrpidia spormannii TaxID=2055160 RepID=A0A2K8N5L7_9BACL|nr:hypothetical protein CVV65_04980 [Kyrpidia spormannii]HHY66672.1 hypothetical protein [Alicyclobacillus sp.]
MENIEAIRTFARSYFIHTGATLIEDSDTRLAVRVPIEIDKELTDRPYYWMWVEATGQEVEPPTYTFIFDPEATEEEDETAEWLAPGSFRLQRMYESVCRRGRYVRQFEVSRPDILLRPVLLVYWKISYVSDRRKDRLLAAAVDLVEGRVTIRTDASLPPVQLSDTPSARHFEKARIDWPEATGLLQAALRLHLSHEDHRWAEEALERLREEEQRLALYFQQILREREEDRRTLEAEWAIRREELKWRLAPRILADPLQWALLFLTPASMLIWFDNRRSASLTRPVDMWEKEGAFLPASVRASQSAGAGHRDRPSVRADSSAQCGFALRPQELPAPGLPARRSPEVDNCS